MMMTLGLVAASAGMAEPRVNRTTATRRKKAEYAVCITILSERFLWPKSFDANRLTAVLRYAALCTLCIFMHGVVCCKQRHLVPSVAWPRARRAVLPRRGGCIVGALRDYVHLFTFGSGSWA